RRTRGVQDPELLANHFHLSRLDRRIDRVLRAQIDHAFDGHDVFRAKLVGLFVHRGVAIGPENDLGYAVAVAKVDEVDSAQIAAAMNPAHQDGALACIGGAKLTTSVGAAKVAEKIERNMFHISCVLSQYCYCTAC